MSRSLLVSRVFPPQTGGSGRWFWEVYRRQPAEGVCVAAGSYPGSEVFDRDCPFPINRLPLHVSNWGLLPWGLRSYAANFRQLLCIVRREHVTSIHAGTLFPEGFLTWLLHKFTGLPYLCYLHGEEIPIAAGSRELSWMARRLLGAADAIVANSENTRALIAAQWPEYVDRTVVLNPGVDSARFTPAAPDAAQRSALGWDGRQVVLTVGRLQARKGHDNLIRALPEIRRQIPNVLYAIVGDGEQRWPLEQLVDEMGVRDCVRFHGEISDDALLRCYQQCDLFVLPNRTIGEDIEGFGMVLVEAQACGKAVIAGDSGGTRETMRVSETGLIVDCGQPEAIARAVTELLTDPERLAHMRRDARDWAVAQYDWARLAEAARGLFSELESRRHSPLPAGPASVGAKRPAPQPASL